MPWVVGSNGAPQTICSKCNGGGVVSSSGGWWENCPACHGKGKVPTATVGGKKQETTRDLGFTPHEKCKHNK